MSPRPLAFAAAVLLLVGALGGLTACGQTTTTGGAGSSTPATPSGTSGTASDPATPPVTRPATGTVTVTGVPEEGVEASCLLLGQYLLVGGTEAQRALLTTGRTAGTAVTVTGHTDATQMSFCQQGTLLVVDEVRAGS